MKLLGLTTKLLVAMAVAVFFLGRASGEAEHPATSVDLASVDVPIDVKAELSRAESSPSHLAPGEFDVASAGSLDSFVPADAANTGTANTGTARPEPLAHFVTGTPVVFERPTVRSDYSLMDAPADMRHADSRLVDASDASVAAELKPEQKVVYVIGSRVNLRQGPDAGTSVLLTLRRGDMAEVIGEGEQGWTNIREVKSGSVGYMAAQFLSDSRP
jgi:hypothetical protein